MIIKHDLVGMLKAGLNSPGSQAHPLPSLDVLRASLPQQVRNLALFLCSGPRTPQLPTSFVISLTGTGILNVGRPLVVEV